jgi:RNAse (barnase) inhibitor barstar
LGLILIEMTTVQIIDLFAGKLTPDVYQLVSPIDPIELANLSRDAGAKLFYLDGQQISDRESLFHQFAIVMQFSDYFGHNWDALWDSLTDLDADGAEWQIIVLDRFDNFERDNPQQWSILLDICQRIVEYFQDTSTPIYILFRGEYSQLQQANLTSI